MKLSSADALSVRRAHRRVPPARREGLRNRSRTTLSSRSPTPVRRTTASNWRLRCSKPTHALVVVDLSRNFVYHKALMTGLSHVTGDIGFPDRQRSGGAARGSAPCGRSTPTRTIASNCLVNENRAGVKVGDHLAEMVSGTNDRIVQAAHRLNLGLRQRGSRLVKKSGGIGRQLSTIQNAAPDPHCRHHCPRQLPAEYEAIVACDRDRGRLG